MLSSGIWDQATRAGVTAASLGVSELPEGLQAASAKATAPVIRPRINVIARSLTQNRV
jgi:hypothetical protein